MPVGHPHGRRARDLGGSLVAPPVLPREGILDIRIGGPQRHKLMLVRLKTGKSLADVQAYLEASTSGLPAGDYVLACAELDWVTPRFHLSTGEAMQLHVG